MVGWSEKENDSMTFDQEEKNIYLAREITRLYVEVSFALLEVDGEERKREKERKR